MPSILHLVHRRPPTARERVATWVVDLRTTQMLGRAIWRMRRGRAPWRGRGR